jgi:hypothetical protein
VQRTMNIPLKRASMHAYIQARDFGNRELVKTEKGKCFRPEYISVNEPSFLERKGASAETNVAIEGMKCLIGVQMRNFIV